jgi:hypothetical protein
MAVNKNEITRQEQLNKLLKDYEKTLKTIKDLKRNLFDGDKLQSSMITEQVKKSKDLKKQIDEINKAIDNQVQDYEDMDDTLISIGNTMKKNQKLAQITADNFGKVKDVSLSIATLLKEGGVKNTKTQKQVIAINDAYKNMHISIAKANKEYALGRISNEDRVALIKREADGFQDVASMIDMSKVSSEELRGVISGMTKEGEMFSKSMKGAKVQSEGLDKVMDSFSGIPAMGELNTLLKTNIKDTLAFKAATFALGAALAKVAYDYFGAPIEVAMQNEFDIRKNRIQTAMDVKKLEIEAQFIPRKIENERQRNQIDTANDINRIQIDGAFAVQKAMVQFNSQLKQGAAQFEAASKTALFGKGIGSIGYGAAQMHLAGVGAEQVASAMTAAASATGKMPSSAVAADMAIMATRTGQSVDNIAEINEYFQRTDKVSAKTAMNLQEGLRAMADQAHIGLGKLMEEIAQNSKDALSYQIKSGPALAKQVAYAQTLGVSFGDIAKAGKNMVLNYKDSIKAEMQLSTLLGKQVDLSEVRAKFASGDTEGGLKALKSQGLDPKDMDMFQQEALQQALGGLDLSSISKVAQNTGAAVGGLQAGSAKGGNQQFLGTKQAAEQTLAAKSAQISAATAEIDAKLSSQITDAYLNSPGYKTYLMAQNDMAKKEAELADTIQAAVLASKEYQKLQAEMVQEQMKFDIGKTLREGLVAAAGGFFTTALGKLIPGGGSGGDVAAAGTAAANGSSISDAVASTTEAATEEATTQSGGFFTRIGEKMDGVIASIAGVFTKIKDGILGTWEKVTGWFTGIGTKISELWGTVTGFFSGIGTKIKDGFLGFVDTVKTKIMDGWNKITGFFSGLIDTIKNFFKAKFSRKGIKSAATSITSDASGGGEEGSEGEGGAGVASQAKAFSKVDFKGAGKGIGSFLQNVGKGAGTFIESIMTGIANGLKAFADPMVVLGAAGLAASIVAVGAGLAGAAWIMGKALPTLAEGFMAFNKVDGKNLASVGLGIGALGVGLTAMGVGAVIGGIGNLIGKLFGGGIEETVEKVEKFSQANINADKVKENSDAIVNYSKAMAASGLGSAAAGLGNLVGGIANGIAKFFGAKPPLEQMREFAKLDFGDTTKLKSNAEAFTTFGNAMASYKGSSGSLGGVLADGVAKFFELEPPVEQMKKFATADFGDISKLKVNAEAFTTFGNAMASYKGSSGGVMEVLAQGISKFFGVEPPFALFERFAKMEGIDVAKTKSNAEAFTAFGNAMASYTGTGTGVWSSLGKGIMDFFGAGDGDLIGKFRQFAALDAGGVTAISTAIGSFNTNLANFKMETAEAAGKGMKSVATATTDYLTSNRTEAITAFAGSIAYINSQLMGLSGMASLMETTSLAFLNLASALDALASVNTKAINDIPWIKMAAFSGVGGRITLAQSATGNFNLTQDTAKNIAHMDRQITQLVQVNKNLQALLAVMTDNEQAATVLQIDGRQVTNMIKRRADNAKAMTAGK